MINQLVVKTVQQTAWQSESRIVLTPVPYLDLSSGARSSSTCGETTQANNTAREAATCSSCVRRHQPTKATRHIETARELVGDAEDANGIKHVVQQGYTGRKQRRQQDTGVVVPEIFERRGLHEAGVVHRELGAMDDLATRLGAGPWHGNNLTRTVP